MNAPVKCNGCQKEFTPPHFNSKCCSDKCRKKSRSLVIKRYKDSDKGIASTKRWQASDLFKNNEKVYRSHPKAKKLAVIRSTRCLKNNPHLQEAKRKRDREFSKSERGREINKRSVKIYFATDNGKIQRKNAKHRRRQREHTGKVTAKEWALKLKEFDYKCAHCCTDENIEMDHIMPLSKGGKHNIDNIQPLCRSCNSKKGNKILWAI